MADEKSVIEQAYSAFNERDIDGALALMTEDVSWPKASEGGRVVGKEEIRAYWTRQWAEFDPHVDPLAITEGDEGKVRVRVHQLVKNLQGEVLTTRTELRNGVMCGSPARTILGPAVIAMKGAVEARLGFPTFLAKQRDQIGSSLTKRQKRRLEPFVLTGSLAARLEENRERLPNATSFRFAQSRESARASKGWRLWPWGIADDRQ
jgi:hypothetical protein